MPAYNCAKDIGRAIESIQKQTMEDWELIIVDDCSKDNTCEIVRGYAAEDDRIILIKQSKNAGPGKAKNDGLKKAMGTYVTFCDSDDWLDTGAYEVLDSQDFDSRDVIVFGYFRDICDEKDCVLETNLVFAENFSTKKKEEVIKQIPILDQKRIFSFAWNKLYRRDIILENKISFSDKKFGEDYDFNIEFFKYAKNLIVSQNGYYHYIKKNTESLTERFVPNFYEINKDRFERMKKLMEAEGCYEDMRGQIMTSYVKHAISAIARFYDKRGDLSLAQIYAKTKSILKEDISIEAIRFAEGSNKGNKLCNAVFKTRSTAVNVLFGWIIWELQTKGKKIFEKLK